MKKILTLVAVVFLANQAMAQCSPSFSYHQNYVTTGDPYGGEVVNTTVYTGPGTATYSLSIYGSPIGGITDSSSVTGGGVTLTMNMVVYDSTTSTLICSDSVTNTLTYVYPACAYTYASFPEVIIDSTHFSLDSTFCHLTTALTTMGDYSYAWTFSDGSTSTSASPSIIYAPGPFYTTPFSYGPFDDGAHAVPYVLTVTGGGCSYTTDTLRATLPHGTFDCSDYYDAFMYAEGSGAGDVAFSISLYHSELIDGIYEPSLTVDFGDGASRTFSYDSVGDVVHHTYDYGGRYNVRYTITLTNSLDSEHQTCIIQPYQMYGYTAGITDSFSIGVNGSSALPIYATTDVTVCAGDTLRLSARDTLHSPNGYYQSFYHHALSTYPTIDLAGPWMSYFSASLGWYPSTDIPDYSTSADSVLIVPNISVADSGIYLFFTDYSDYGSEVVYTYPVHVTVLPTFVPSITGVTTLCAGATTSLSDSVSGGVWSSTGGATVSAGGVVTGVSGGSATVSYTITNSCGSYTAATAVTITTLPTADTIMGDTVVCVGSTITLSDVITGGVWSGDAPTIAAVTTDGVVTGVSVGTSTISYAVTNSCGTTTATRTLNTWGTPVLSPITGTSVLCAGETGALTEATAGVTWSVSGGFATISSTGVVTGIGPGPATCVCGAMNVCGISTVTFVVDIHALPTVAPITGTTSVCVGGSTTLNDTTTGGVWSTPSIVASVTDGVVTTTTAGTATISYSVTNDCGTTAATTTYTINALPEVTATNTTTCSNGQTLTAGGATSYEWTPATDLSCSTCGTTTTTVTTATTFTVNGTDVNGCTNTATTTPNVNRIYGHISFGGATPDTLDTKVWLIKYNSTDSSLTALDSTVTCLDGGVPYYEFDGQPAGDYMVKGKLIYGEVPGASGYIPTYSLGTLYWYEAATASHTSATDSLPITMVYGTVPSGAGFISGYVFSGAGKNTSPDVPVVGMIVYLRNAATSVLTHVYTDVTGMYAFSGLADGTYDVFPSDYAYYTIPSASMTLAPGTETMTNVNFKKHTTLGTITPYDGPTVVPTVQPTDRINVYPNPASGLLIVELSASTPVLKGGVILRDVLGKIVYSGDVISAKTKIDVSGFAKGVYMISVQAGDVWYNGKVVVE